MAAGQPLSRVRLAAVSVADDLGYAALAPLGRYCPNGSDGTASGPASRAPHRRAVATSGGPRSPADGAADSF